MVKLCVASYFCSGFWCLGTGLKRRGSSQWNITYGRQHLHQHTCTSHWELLAYIIKILNRSEKGQGVYKAFVTILNTNCITSCTSILYMWTWLSSESALFNSPIIVQNRISAITYLIMRVYVFSARNLSLNLSTTWLNTFRSPVSTAGEKIYRIIKKCWEFSCNGWFQSAMSPSYP